MFKRKRERGKHLVQCCTLKLEYFKCSEWNQNLLWIEMKKDYVHDNENPVRPNENHVHHNENHVHHNENHVHHNENHVHHNEYYVSHNENDNRKG